jgi:uncharacterized protein DUF3592
MSIRIGFSFSGRTSLLWIGGGFFAIGLIFVYAGIQDATRERAYQEQGQVVEAVVVDKTIQRASREGNTSTRYEIAYRFTAPNGRAVEGLDKVEVEEWERLAPGSAFKITYLPGAPETNRAEGSGDIASTYIMMGLGSVFALIGGVLFAWTSRRLVRERGLLREGTAAKGTVLAVKPTTVYVNSVQQWEVRYRYLDSLGRSHEGTSGPVPPEEANSVEVGDKIPIRFDRERSGVSVWVGTERSRK